MPTEAGRVLPGREGGGAGAARPGGVSERAWGPRSAGSSPAPPGPRPRSTAARSPLGARLGPAPAPQQPGAGEAQGASAKSEELNNELGIGSGSVAHPSECAITTLGASPPALAKSIVILGPCTYDPQVCRGP